MTAGDAAHRVTIGEGERMVFGTAGGLAALDHARRVRNGIEYSFQPVGRQEVDALATLAADVVDRAEAYVDTQCPTGSG